MMKPTFGITWLPPEGPEKLGLLRTTTLVIIYSIESKLDV